MEVVWSRVAKENIGTLIKYLMEHYGRKVTAECLTKLLSAVNTIAQHPEIGKRIGTDRRAFVVAKQISIHYRVTSRIEIIMLWDNRQMPN